MDKLLLLVMGGAGGLFLGLLKPEWLCEKCRIWICVVLGILIPTFFVLYAAFFVLDISERSRVVRFLKKKLKEGLKLQKHKELKPLNRKFDMKNFEIEFHEWREKISFFYRNWSTDVVENRFTEYYSKYLEDFEKFHKDDVEKPNNYFRLVLDIDIQHLKDHLWRIEREGVPKSFDPKIIPYLKRNS